MESAQPAPRTRARPTIRPLGAPTALALGLCLLAGVLVLVLSGSPARVAASNGMSSKQTLAPTEGTSALCQAHESLPRETSAVRASLAAIIGPRVSVQVRSGGRLLTSGSRGSGWTGASVTVPVGTLAAAATNATVCFAIAPTRTRVTVLGQPTDPQAAASSGASALPGRIRVEYMAQGSSSWWSQALAVARRMGLGRGVSGTWIALLAAALMLALVAVIAWLLLAQPGARRERTLLRVPLAAWACALVACLNAVCWSVVTPPFQVPDEPNHFAYVQLVAENHQLPGAGLGFRSPALAIALRDLSFTEVRLAPQRRSLASVAQQRRLERDLALPLPLSGRGGAGTASSEPPLYYGLEAIPYELGAWGTVLDRLELMRLLSALMAACTALFGYLFVREALPHARRAWSVGGLAVALFPLLGFVSGGLNPDAMLFAVCAALYYCLARAFRRGLTPQLAGVGGALVAVGFLTKLNFAGFAPGALLGLALAARHSARLGRPGAWRSLAIALAIALGPVALYGIVNLISSRPTLGAASQTLNGTHGSPISELDYIWQLFLPRLPGTPNYFPGIFTTRQLWFNGLVGLYGWLDTPFPGWVYDLALAPVALIALLALRELAHRRAIVRGRASELLAYLLPGLGVLLMVGGQSYVSDLVDKQEPFAEPRYLLPMLALWGLIAALATRGAGRRWRPVVGVALVVLFLGHDLFSQLQTISRYYG